MTLAALTSRRVPCRVQTEKFNGILKTKAVHTKKLRAQAKAPSDAEARSRLMRQQQLYQIARDVRIMVALEKLQTHPEIKTWEKEMYGENCFKQSAEVTDVSEVSCATKPMKCNPAYNADVKYEKLQGSFAVQSCFHAKVPAGLQAPINWQESLTRPVVDKDGPTSKHGQALCCVDDCKNWARARGRCCVHDPKPNLKQKSMRGSPQKKKGKTSHQSHD